MDIMRYEGINGDICDFVPKRFDPLSYSELLSADIKKDKTYTMLIEAESIDLKTEDERISEQSGRIELPSFVFKRELKIYALVDGGWLPPPFVRPRNLLADSNVVINFEKILKGNRNSNIQEMKWWLDWLNSPNLVINPILYAIEGKQRKTPTLKEIKTLFEESYETIKKVLPNAKLIVFNDESYSAVYNIIVNLSERRKKESDFLIKIAPLIVKHNSYSKLSEIESDILNIAVSLKVDLKSFVVLAALSCLYESNDGTNFPTARRIIFERKNSSKYTQEIAYNTLSDLNALEIFVGSLALPIPFAFCTCDKALALFGCGLNFRNVKFNHDNEPNFDISIEKCLFPRLNEQERKALSEKLTR